MDGLEVQVAMIGGSSSLPRQAESLGRLAAVMRRRGRSPARPIERLAERVELAELPAAINGHAVIGVGDEDLQPYAIETQGSFLVVGPPVSGRTTALASIITATRRAAPRTVSYLFGAKRTVLRHMDPWESIAVTDEEMSELAADLSYRLSSGTLVPEPTCPVLIVVESFEALVGAMAESAIDALVRTAVGYDAFVVGESETSALSSAYTLGTTFKQARRGIALQPDDMDGQTVFKQSFPRASRSEFPPGRGIVVDGGRAMRVQLGLPS
ncbi:MAG: hypothetical protein QM597_07460 [Aeromicrobium sp.]|uniref:hypothetical protein n=1 Tax=Aeromicrobium sp. TaxID=1871063 RepID=UPI0039E40892